MKRTDQSCLSEASDHIKRQSCADCLFIYASKSVSRVLYRTVIYLGLALPPSSVPPPRDSRAGYVSLHGVASDRVYTAVMSPLPR